MSPRDISTDLLEQLESNRAAMYEIAGEFLEGEKHLLRTSIDVALFCHYGHTRIGEPPVHYSHHLLEVMRRVNAPFCARQPDSSSERGLLAVQLSVAVLHDSMEDISRTFPQITDRQEGFSIVEQYIRSRLICVTDPSTVNDVCESIRTLSIGNDADFSDSEYVSKIMQSAICKPIKLADVNHNMLTIPDVSPFAGAVSCPAQYNQLMKGSPFYDEFVRQVIVSAKRSQQTVNPADLASTKLGRALQKLHRFEGAPGLDRLHEFYKTVEEKLKSEPNAQIFPTRYTAAQLAKAVRSQLDAIKTVRTVLE
jgi:hypothetical protein